MTGRRIEDYKIERHGIHNHQGFPGADKGEWDVAVNGVGWTEEAALEDALDKLVMAGWDIRLEQPADAVEHFGQVDDWGIAHEAPEEMRDGTTVRDALQPYDVIDEDEEIDLEENRYYVTVYAREPEPFEPSEYDEEYALNLRDICQGDLDRARGMARQIEDIARRRRVLKALADLEPDPEPGEVLDQYRTAQALVHALAPEPGSSGEHTLWVDYYGNGQVKGTPVDWHVLESILEHRADEVTLVEREEIVGEDAERLVVEVESGRRRYEVVYGVEVVNPGARS